MVATRVPDDPSRHQLDALWASVREELRGCVPESTFRLWLEPLKPAAAAGDTLYLSAPEGVRAWVERRYTSLIGEALRSSDSGLTQVAF